MSKSKETGEHVPVEIDYPEAGAQSGSPEGNEPPAEPIPAESVGERGGEDQAEGQAQPETPEHLDGENIPGDKLPEAGGEPKLLTIEELAEKLKVGKPVLAAVKQSEGWSEGKKVTEAVFKTAIETFLGAPMGGKAETPKEGEAKLPEGGEQNPPEGDKS
jgi:hypothetical protein